MQIKRIRMIRTGSHITPFIPMTNQHEQEAERRALRAISWIGFLLVPALIIASWHVEIDHEGLKFCKREAIWSSTDCVRLN